MNLRELAEYNNVHILEDYDSGFGMPVELVDPDGAVQVYSANDPEKFLAGQVVLHTIVEDMEGQPVVSNQRAVTLRRSSLNRIPLDTEKQLWSVKIPELPSPTAPKVTYLMDRPAEGGEDIGIITLYLIRCEQS